MCHMHHVSANRSEMQEIVIFKIESGHICKWQANYNDFRNDVIFGGEWVISSFYDEVVTVGWMGPKIRKF